MSIPQSIDVSTGSTWCDQKFVGAHFYRSTVRKLQKVATVAEDGALRFPVSLVPEPDNPYSKSGCAISVRWNGKTIGHLPDDDATKFWPELCRIAASGHVATAHARLWFRGSLRDEDTKLFGSVDVRKPGQWVPLNDPPLEGYAFIPQGGRIQVTKEADHFDVLQDFVPPQGTGLLIVTLHRVLVGKNGDLPRVEVRLDGERVGELSKISSEKLLPAVEYFETLGLSTSCIAQIKGSSLAAELILLAQKATEMGDELLNPEISPLPVLVEFEANPQNYEVPAAWQPSGDDKKRKVAPEAAAASSDDPLGDALLAEYYKSVVHPAGNPPAPAAAFGPQTPQLPQMLPAAQFPQVPHMPHMQPAASFAYAPQQRPAYAVRVPTKDFSTYLALAVLGGWLGLHHFYMGSAGKGVVYFLTGGLFAIGWIIDILTAKRQFNAAMTIIVQPS